MLNSVIRFSLRHRFLVAALALVVLGWGGWQLFHLPIDVFPDLNRPRVVVMTEAPGMAPEEVEAMITIPLESVLNGATGVQAVRSASGVGTSVVQVEFDWGTDIYVDRQIVNEKISLAADRLPAGVKPQLTPISSVMGQIVIVGMWSDNGETDPLELRTLADWVVAQRLRTIPGIAQVTTMGGHRKQFQVRVNPNQLLFCGVTLEEVETALQKSNENVAGGYLTGLGPHEYLVRGLGRVQSIEDLRELVVKTRGDRPVTLRQVARVVEGPQVKRGDSAAHVRQEDGRFAGGPAVVLTVSKQPGADTRRLTDEVTAALDDLKSALPADVRIAPDLYQQKQFIDLAIANVVHALRDGGILVAVVLFLFLLNFRTTFITLTAIPLSIVVTALVFRWFGMTINTMTLGGLAVAIGELVDDAIVDVENIFRRLRENRRSAEPKPALLVVYRASTEIRNSIVFSTLIIVLVFIPLFALSGMEGRLFAPLAVAYIVSILASLLVSLTVTPVLSYWLLGKTRPTGTVPLADRNRERDGFLLRGLKAAAGRAIGASLRAPKPILLSAVAAVGLAVLALLGTEGDFMPPFDEGVAQLNVVLQPGTSLEYSKDIAEKVERRLKKIDGVQGFVARTGRAEMDEHIIGVNMTEFIINFDRRSGRSREAVLDDIREAMADIPGINTSVEQPLAHLISGMLSGVQSQVAVKLYGDDLGVLRSKILEMKAAVADVPGVRDLMEEPQTPIPQLRIEVDRTKLARRGLTPGDINRFVETAMHGKVLSEVLIDQRTAELFVRFDEPYRQNVEDLHRLSLELLGRETTPLGEVARIYEAFGPNTINRERVQRRVVLQCNVAGRGLVDVVRDIQRRLEPIRATLPAGYRIEYGGQFESQQSASRTIAVLFAVSVGGMFLVLFTMFRSVNFSLQIMAALPMAFLGAVAALKLTGQTLTVASMVGFISLCGIATRNGILLLDHYLHLVRHEGETWSMNMIVRAGQERLAPVLMTALTAGIGLLPLALAAGEPGKEILYPVATVIIGGLLSSTLLEFLVRPALFWTFGRKAGERLLVDAHADVELTDAEHDGRDHGKDETQ